MAVLLLAMLVREEEQTYQQELLDLRNDFVFKSFFGNKRNIKLLLHFLNTVLEEEISSIKLIDPHLETTHKNDKSSVMDVRVETERGEQINIEIQLRYHQGFEERMLMYWTKMYGSQDHSGHGYMRLNRAVQIIITDFEMFSTQRFHRKFRLMDNIDHVVLTNHIEMHVLQLPLVESENVKDRSELEQWLLFLKGNQKIKEGLAMESTTMKEAFEEIERLSQNPETRRLADYWQHELRGRMQIEADAKEQGLKRGLKEGLERGLERGLEQGVEQGKKEVVIHMYRKNTQLEDIANLTDISLEKVKEIIESIN